MKNSEPSHKFQAYRESVDDLRDVRAEKEKLLSRLKELSNREGALVKLTETLFPLIKDELEIDSNESEIISQQVVKWRSKTLEFLKKNTDKKFLSSQLLEFIHPQANTLLKADRRRAMINLSAALSKLVDDGLIMEEENSGGKGHLYWHELLQIPQSRSNTIIQENPVKNEIFSENDT